VPAGKVQRVGDLLEGDPHLEARHFYELTHHPVMGEVWLDGGPFRLRSTPGSLLGRAGPLMGQDTREILREVVGVQEDELESLLDRGAAYCQPATEATEAAG
jgi:crotonobetainyl-CoA:carnitine CoA-transferase CaiB-like acyl-CoA transferase